MAVSSCVVVGLRNSSVSDRMQVSIAPLMFSGICAMSSPIILYMIVAVQASVSITMLTGPLVSSPPTRRWWSMMAVMSASLMLAGSSAGLLVSTITTGWSACTSSMICGLSSFQWSSMNSASVLGSPSRAGAAATPLISFRYHAQMIGLPVLSVSGDLWPKTSVVIGDILKWESVDLRALYGWLHHLSPPA